MARQAALRQRKEGRSVRAWACNAPRNLLAAVFRAVLLALALPAWALPAQSPQEALPADAPMPQVRVVDAAASTSRADVPEAAESVAPRQRPAERPVARVNGTVLTLGHVIAFAENLPSEVTDIPDHILFAELVNHLVEQELLAQAAAGQLRSGEIMRLEARTRAFLASVTLERAVAGAVTEAAIVAAYETFARTLTQSEPVHEWNAAQILVRDRAAAEAAQIALAAGRPFAEVAAEMSIDPSAQQGGVIGWFRAGTMIPEFEAAVRRLRPGEISEPFESRFGWHLVMLIDERLSGAPPLGEVREALAEELARLARSKLIETLRKDAEIALFLDDVDPSLAKNHALLDD